MNATGSKLLPAPPRLFASLLAGFDTVTTHLFLILFPLALDLFLWLGLRLRTRQLFERLVAWMINLPGADTPQAAELLQVNVESLQNFGERFNLGIALRTYPVGIPSLIATRMPVDAPPGFPLGDWEIADFTTMLIGGILLILAGYALGALYYFAVADAVVSGKVRWSRILRTWPWAASQSFLLALFWLSLILMISIPASCMILFINLSSPSIARVILLLYGGVLIWLFFLLFFSPHGIFIKGNNVFTSLKRGIFITQITFPSTGIFLVVILIIGQILDVLWQIPEENSWFVLVGLFGHAFVATGLLASSFIYYREADRWLHSLSMQREEMVS